MRHYCIAAVAISLFANAQNANSQQASGTAANTAAPALQPIAPPNFVGLTALERRVQEQEAHAKSSEAKLSKALEELVKSKAVAGDVVKKLAESEKERLDDQRKLLRTRYEGGTELLEAMRGSAGTILLITQLLQITTKLDQSTSLWRDESFRNGWDWFNKIGTVIGSVTALVGAGVAANGTTGAGAATAAVGAGVLGVAQLLGMILGEDTANTVREKALWIDFSRKAYDDLSVRIDNAQALDLSTTTFLREMEAFQVKYQVLKNFPVSQGNVAGGPVVNGDKAEPGLGAEYEQRRSALNDLALVVERFLVITSFVPQLLESFEVLIKKYEEMAKKYQKEIEKLKESIFVKLTEDMKTIRGKLTSARENYEARVKPFLSLSKRILAIFPRA